MLGYCVEKRDAKRSTWSFVARTERPSTDVSGLADTSTYHFRVAAENAQGTGPTLDTETPVALKKAAGKFFIFHKAKNMVLSDLQRVFISLLFCSKTAIAK